MSQQQADNTLYENSIGWFILICVLLCLLALFWYYFAEDVKSLVRWVRWGQMWLIHWFVDNEYAVQWGRNQVNFIQWYEGIPNLDKSQLDARTMSVIGTLAMEPMKLIFVILLALGGLWCMFRGPNTQYRTSLSVETLIQRQSTNFPVISPFVQFNPSKQPPRPPGSPVPAELPLFAEALGPEEWLAYKGIPIPDGNVDEEAAYRAFREQLGGRWRGAAKLAPYKQVLLAAFCLKAARKRSDSDAMLGRLANCWDAKKGLVLSKDRKLLGQARSILKNREMSAKLLAKCNQHAFETTALLRGLQVAREEGGVLAPAQFVWLRAHDRALWYPMNNLGRQSFHMEAMGAMAHFKMEKMTQRPIPKPKLDDAIDSIVGYVKSDVMRPVPQLDYSQSKKRGVKKAV